jgi:hypothetical protein
MNRVLLVVAVVVFAIGAWFLFRKEKPDETTSAGSAASEPTITSSGTSSVTPSSGPRLPSSDDSNRPTIPPEGSANEYEVGGVRIRDHRSGSNAPLDIPPNIHRPNTRELPSTLTQAVAQQVRGVLADCARDNLPKEARGEHPRLEGQLIVGIKDHTLTVTGATMQLRDATGDAALATKQCVEQKSVGLTTPATDQDDLDNYSIGVTFAVL